MHIYWYLLKAPDTNPLLVLQIVITSVSCAWITFMIPTEPEQDTPILGVRIKRCINTQRQLDTLLSTRLHYDNLVRLLIALTASPLKRWY